MKCICPRCQFKYSLQTKEKVNRTLAQNKLYWKWMTILAEDLGERTKEEMHYVFKRQFLADKMPVFSPDQFTAYLKTLNYKEVSTTKLDTATMTEYLNNVNFQALELGITLPTE